MLLISEDYRIDLSERIYLGYGVHISPNIIDLFIFRINDFFVNRLAFDATVIFSTVWFQFIIPFFAVISGIVFYRVNGTILQMDLYRKVSYRKEVYKLIMKNSLKSALSVYLAYTVFVIWLYINLITHGELILGASNRSLLGDIFGSPFYLNQPLLFFMIEGFVRFFMMIFAYATLTQSVALFGNNLKVIIATPLVYYFGLSAIGYAFNKTMPFITTNITPAIIMSNGDFTNVNSIVMILVNMIPLYIGIGIIFWRTKYDEI